MKKLTKLSMAVALSLVGASASAANIVADGRGNGMGNTGVTTADFLLAPFYNPALAAVHRDEDQFGLLLPAIGATARDTDDTVGTIDDLQSKIDDFEQSGSSDPAIAAELNKYLDQLSDDKPLAVTAGVGAAIALPIRTLSANLYTRAYAEVIAQADIADNTGDNAVAVKNRYESSSVDMIAFGYNEVGLALAKRMSVAGRDVAFGVTPKFQKLMTYIQSPNVNDFDVDNYDESEMSESAFNMDLGAVWFYDAFRAGVAVKDLFAQEIATKTGNHTYKLDTQITLSGAYSTRFFTATADWDVTKQTRFDRFNDDTQFLRFGIEGNAWDWAQLRAGYEIDLEETLDNSITAGIGISPWDVVSLDLAANYAGENQFGVSGNLALTF